MKTWMWIIYEERHTHKNFKGRCLWAHFPFFYSISRTLVLLILLWTHFLTGFVCKGCCPWAWFYWKSKNSLGGEKYVILVLWLSNLGPMKNIKNESGHWENGTFCNTLINLLWTCEYFYVQQLHLKTGFIAQSQKCCSIMISLNWYRMYLVHFLSYTRAVESRGVLRWSTTCGNFVQRISIVSWISDEILLPNPASFCTKLHLTHISWNLSGIWIALSTLTSLHLYETLKCCR